MARPTEEEKAKAALGIMDVLVDDAEGSIRSAVGTERFALQVLRDATKPRPVWPVKEAADYLGVRVENLRPDKLRGLPAPAYEFPRATRTDLARTMRLFWVDEIVAYKPVLEATPRRRNARKKAANDGT